MRSLVPLALVGALLLVVAIADDPAPEADLVIVNSNEAFTLDPQRMTWLQDFRLAYALYEGLARWDLDTSEAVPAAATWSRSDDGRTYTFHLRPDARWSNGDPVTADDFIWSWQRAMLPDTAGGYAALFRVIDGAEAFFRWRVEALRGFAQDAVGLDDAERAGRANRLWEATQRRFEEGVGLSAPGKRTLVVRLAAPVPYFPDLVAFAPFHPVHRPTVERWSRLDPASGRMEQRHGWTKAGRHVGNGPYVLARWRYRRGMVLEASPTYHSPELVRSRRIEILSIEDVNTRVLAFESGRVDWLSDVGAEYQADLLAERQAYEQTHADAIAAGLAAGGDPDHVLATLPAPRGGERRDIHAFPAFGTDFYSFNCRPRLDDGRDNPFADAAVRRAFVLSVDRTALVEQVTRLREPVQHTLVPPGSIPGYRSPGGLRHDPDRARRELDAAGWRDRDGDGVVENEADRPFPVIDLLYSTNTPRYRDLSLALRDMWQRELGVRVELRGKESKFFRDDVKKGHFMIARGGWYGDYGDPTTFLDLCRTGDGNNTRGFSSPYVDELLTLAEREADSDARLRLLEECERFLFEEQVPMLVLCQYVQLYMYEPGRLRGLSRHPRLTQYLWRLEAVEP